MQTSLLKAKFLIHCGALAKNLKLFFFNIDSKTIPTDLSKGEVLYNSLLYIAIKCKKVLFFPRCLNIRFFFIRMSVSKYQKQRFLFTKISKLKLVAVN